jgi:hypothetical protein
MDPTQAIAAQPASPRHGPNVPWLPFLAFLILVVYPLSMGPTFKLIQLRILPMQVIYIYDPLQAVIAHSTVLQNFFNWYITRLWSAGFM